MCECNHCEIEMTSLDNSIHWCSNCGKITSIFVDEMMPAISQIIFDAKKSAKIETDELPKSEIKVIYNGPPKLKVIQ